MKILNDEYIGVLTDKVSFFMTKREAYLNYIKTIIQKEIKMNQEIIWPLSKLEDSLTYMNKDLANQIKYIFQAEEHSITLNDIIYINNTYNNKRLKDLIKNFDFRIKKFGLLSLLSIRKNLINSEEKEFIKYLELWFNKHLDNRYSTFVFDLENKPINTNNIIDFICLANNNITINEIQFNLFIRIINDCEKNKNATKILLTYVKDLHLSHFFKLIDSFVRDINKKEKILNSEDKSLIGKEKRGIYRRTVEIFISYLSPKNIKQIQNSPFHNTIEQYVKGIHYDGENAKEKEDNSHFIQSAYLKRIFQNKDINYNGYIINPYKYSEANPYCKKLFYGSSLPKDSIEKRLKVVEGKFNHYLNELEKHIQTVDFFLKDSFYDINIPAHTENKLIFLLNYIRTPSFIEDLYFSYLKYLKNQEKNIINMEAQELAKGINQNLNHFELRKFFKIWQLAYIEEILDMLENKNILLSEQKILRNVLLKSEFRYNKSLEFEFNNKFFEIIFYKFGNFIEKSYAIGISRFKLNTYSDNLFIIKNYEDNNYELFEDKKEIQIAYFPINNNKILYMINYEKDKDSKFIGQFFHNKSEEFKENIMINKRNIFTITLVNN